MLPGFLVRKLYKRGSLRETAEGYFAFSIHNPLGKATLIQPPHFTINGIRYAPAKVDAGELDLAGISPDQPLDFTKGMVVELRFKGRLLRGANRLHMTVESKEFGPIELFVEEQEAAYCDLRFDEEE